MLAEHGDVALVLPLNRALPLAACCCRVSSCWLLVYGYGAALPMAARAPISAGAFPPGAPPPSGSAKPVCMPGAKGADCLGPIATKNVARLNDDLVRVQRAAHP